MELQNKRNQRIKRLGIYFIIAILTMIINILLYIHVTWYFINHIADFLSENVSLLYISKPIYFEGLFRSLVLCLTVNLFFLLLVESVVIWLFHKRINKVFKINNLFTTKKIIWLAIIIMGINLIASYWIWKNDPQTIKFYPVEVEDESIMNNTDCRLH